MKTLTTIVLALSLVMFGSARAAESAPPAAGAAQKQDAVTHPPHSHPAEKGIIPQPQRRAQPAHPRKKPKEDRHEHGKERH